MKHNKTLEDRIRTIKAKTGIKTFGCNSQMLDIFTFSELKELERHGLIYKIETSKRRLRNEM